MQDSAQVTLVEEQEEAALAKMDSWESREDLIEEEEEKEAVLRQEALVIVEVLNFLVVEISRVRLRLAH